MILGITSLNHDASMALIDNTDIVWAAHSERYSRKKNDMYLNQDIISDMKKYGIPEKIIWFERPFLKSLRKIYSGERPWKVEVKEELKKYNLDNLPIEFIKHHESHAAAGFYTSKFQDAAILVIDAIGEWDTVTIWNADKLGLKQIWNKKYPNSIGLFYTAFTDYIGLRPNEEEYILMGMAAFGKPTVVDKIKKDFFDRCNYPDFKLKYNLHRGCKWWNRPNGVSDFDIAASVQYILEEYVLETVQWIFKNCKSKNLVFMGGVALNCVANSKIAQLNLFNDIWIMPNPGDAGSAIGCVAAYKKEHLNWQGPYLGTDIKKPINIDEIIRELAEGKVVAVAHGRAEFGPRALGNRSLLCDPRGPKAKYRMNRIKRREEFRPFAPAILEEYSHEYFDMPVKSSPYMQFVAQCKIPDQLPGICHVDGSSRVQTVNQTDNSVFRLILEKWYKETGCPVLMNTSLNVKREPLVNSWKDAIRWQQLNGIKVF